MNIERIYVAGHRLDVRFTQCCVASIRHWHPRLPISLIKDEANGAYDTSDLERFWDVELFVPAGGIMGPRLSKLEPFFLQRRERCLILDSDIVFIGKVLDRLNNHDEDVVVDGRPTVPEGAATDYFDVEGLAAIDPDYTFPGFTFNTGAMVATSGLFTRADFTSFLTEHPPHEVKRPDVFKCGDQGLVNYVLQKSVADGRISLGVEECMWWAGWLPRLRVRTRRLGANSPSPVLVHWAGPKKPHFFDERNSHLLRHFEGMHYSRLPRGRRRPAHDRVGQFMRAASRALGRGGGT